MTYQLEQLRQECKELGEVFGASAVYYEIVAGLTDIKKLDAIRERALADAYGDDY